MSTTVSLRGHGHYGLVTTPDHPFYSKRITKRWPYVRGQKKRPGMQRELVENPYWPKASAMKDKLWATPRAFAESAIPTCAGASFSDAFFYFVGRWIGDGFASKGDVLICCGAHEFEEMRARFAEHPVRRGDGSIVEPRSSDLDTPCPRMAWGNAPLERWLREQFGGECESKTLPTWCLSMQASWRRALLDGYVDSDGCVTEGVVSTSSVSKSLAVGMRLLAISLGHVATLYRREGRAGQIDGRAFQGRDIYSVVWRETLERRQTFQDTNHLFAPVREVEATGREENVFCLEVEEDHSYVADGVVVHNCTFFSKAKGGPLDRKTASKVRALAWVVTRWARTVRPSVILLENVEAFAQWGPLLPNGKPCPARKGVTFRRWVKRLRDEGYAVEWRELRACDYGAPTTRKRLFVIARCDGQPIVWPAPTHGSGLRPYLSAASCIDWSIPVPSIFDRAKPLAEATLRRIARGLRKFALETDRPFIVGDDVPSLVHVSNGERPGQAPRVYDIQQPLGTVVAGGIKHALVAAFVAKHYGGHGTPGQSLTLPLGTVTCRDHHALVTAAASGERHADVRAFLTRYNGQGEGQPLQLPLGTVTTRDRFGLVTVQGETFEIRDIGMRMLTPRELVRAQGFPDSYELAPLLAGKPIGPTTQVRLIGNSVASPVAEALVRANVASAAEVAA